MTPDIDGAPSPDKAPAAVQSVDRALMVLEILGKFGSAGVTEIATELGVHKSTVSRLITVLESRGFVEQLSERGKYRLGFTIVRLAGSTSAQMDLAKESQPVCDELAQQSGETTNIAILDDVDDPRAVEDRDELAQQSGETTNIAILDGARIINVVEAHGPAEITLRTWVGQNCPAHATSSGKALLSGLSAAAVRELLGDPLPTFTETTIADVDSLLAELQRVRQVGWASVSEELEVGLNAIGAPVRDSTGKIVAALSVSGPAYRLGADRFEEVAAMTMLAARQISRRLGFVG